ncbi:MAG: hypothetical protein GY847_27735 [Proteobacteria bacterium]|nr:hypothetical protein [Pseudomonadota bacterium]
MREDPADNSEKKVEALCKKFVSHLEWRIQTTETARYVASGPPGYTQAATLLNKLQRAYEKALRTVEMGIADIANESPWFHDDDAQGRLAHARQTEATIVPLVPISEYWCVWDEDADNERSKMADVSAKTQERHRFAVTDLELVGRLADVCGIPPDARLRRMAKVTERWHSLLSSAWQKYHREPLGTTASYLIPQSQPVAHNKTDPAILQLAFGLVEIDPTISPAKVWKTVVGLADDSNEDPISNYDEITTQSGKSGASLENRIKKAIRNAKALPAD